MQLKDLTIEQFVNIMKEHPEMIDPDNIVWFEDLGHNCFMIDGVLVLDLEIEVK